VSRVKQLLCLGAACVASLLCFGAGPAAAADFTVNDSGVGSDVVPGDGTCEVTPMAGDCTLRAALGEANDDMGTNDVISFQPGLGPIDPTTTAFDVLGPVTIDGNGSSGVGATVIDGADLRQLFLVASTASPVTFRDLRLEDGFVASGGGAALRTDAATSLNNVVVTSSSASTATGAVHGAGVFNSSSTATLHVTGSEITDNVITTAPTFGATGAGIASAGPMSITNSVISGNRIDDGGGTSAQGGGIRVDGGFAMDRVTIANNEVNGMGAEGAGIFNGSNDPASPRAITNTTFSGNDAGTSPIGAGGAHMGGDAAFTNVTFRSNTGSPGADLTQFDGTSTARNSIFASSGACAVIGGGLFNTATPGHNIDAGTTCGFETGVEGNMASTDPLLVGPAQGGAPLQTFHIPLPNSPAIDNADPSCGQDLMLDQRGRERPQGPACDIGAYERDYRDLNVTVAGSGTVAGTGVNCVNSTGDCTHEFLDGGPGFVLTATPAAGFQFSSWSGGCASTAGNQCTVNTGNDQMVTATFTELPPTGGGGTTTPPTPPKKKCKKGQKLKKGKCVKKKKKKRKKK
jgi:Divergent InlB B-repeat domain